MGYRWKTWMFVPVVLLALGLGTATAQETSPGEGEAVAEATIPASLASPAATLSTFLDAMNAEPPDREAAVACLDLSSTTVDAGWTLAIRLYGVLNKIELIEVADHPDSTDLAGASAGLTEYVFFPRTSPENPALGKTFFRHLRLQELAGPGARIVLARTDGGWKFSSSTVTRIDDIYHALEREADAAVGLRDVADLSSAIWFERHLPEWALEQAVGLRVWQWIAIGVFVFLGVLLDFLVRALVSLIARRIIARQGGTAQTETLKRTVRPFGLAVAALFWLWAVAIIELPPTALSVLLPAVRLFAMLAMVWALFRVTDLVGEVASSKASETDTKFDDLLVPLVRKTLKIIILIFGLIYIANSFHISIMPLLTGLGIGGVSFAFAAKDTLEHLFGSITVIADRPFQVGDWVKIGDTEGTVEEVGFRSTRIRTFYNSEVTVPNGNLVRAVIDNYGRRKYRRWTTHLNLTYDTPPDVMEAFCEGIRELIRLHPYTRKDYYQVWLHKFGPHSLDVLLYLFFECPDWNTELRERHRMMLDIIRLADRMGVGFAFPTQTVLLGRDGESGEALATQQRGSEIQAQRDGRAAVQDMTADASWRHRKPGPYRFRGAGEPTDPDDDDSQIESKIGGDAG